MNKYKVTGADKESGNDRCEIVSANNPQKAADAARAKGMYVSSVENLTERKVVSRKKKKQPKYLFLHFLASLMIVIGVLVVAISFILLLLVLVADFKLNGSEAGGSFLSLIVLIPMFLWGVVIGAMGGFLMAVKDIAMNTWDSANRVTRVQVCR